MPGTSTIRDIRSFEDTIAGFDENTKSIATAFAAFVDGRMKNDLQKQVAAWHTLITAIDERLDSRIERLAGQMLSGKEISKRLREYQYYESEHID